MIKYSHHFLLISILFLLFACEEKVETKKTTLLEEKPTVEANWSDSLSKTNTSIESNQVDGCTGSTTLGDLSKVEDWDSAELEKYEKVHSGVNSFRGSIPD